MVFQNSIFANRVTKKNSLEKVYTTPTPLKCSLGAEKNSLTFEPKRSCGGHKLLLPQWCS